MEGLRALVSWLAITDLDTLEHSKGKAMVKDALDSLEQEFETSDEGTDDEESLLEDMLDALEAIYEDFLEGGIPAQALREFHTRFHSHLVKKQEAAGTILERELRDLADDLSEEDWCTDSYIKLERAIEAFLDGETLRLEEFIQEMEAALEQAWQPYSDMPLAESEVTAETVVGHQLLSDGLQEWKQALELLREAAAQEEPDWGDALDAAQSGNRLLVTVQKFNQRLQRQV